jgi:hypothetical protein
MWLMECPDEAGHQRSLKTRLEPPELKAVRDEMKTWISHADLGIWEQNGPWNPMFLWLPSVSARSLGSVEGEVGVWIQQGWQARIAGSQIGELLDSVGIDGRRMQRIANEMASPETTFVFRAMRVDPMITLRCQ